MPGVTVVTGINNVGKTRLLQLLSQIHQSWERPPIKFNRLSIEYTDETVSSSLVINEYENPVGVYRRMVEGQIVKELVAEKNGGIIRIRLSPNSFLQDPKVLKQFTAQHDDEMDRVMSSFIFVPAQRIISGSASITRELTPNPSGSNMAQLLLTLRNDMDERFDVLRSIIKKMFPEIDDILTLITGANQTKIIIQDRFSGQRVGINDCGTGVAQMMHLLALILFSPPGRLFLIDEPHVYLHASAERALAEVIRTHPEHHYVIATHSPVLIDALQPDRIWLVTRDARGSMITPLFALGFEERRYVFRLLGWKPSQFAWADRILFVEGDSDDTVWQAWFRLWGWDNPSVRCAVVSLDGAGLTRPLASVIDELSSWLLVPMRVVLDGDQRGTIQSPYVDFLPEVEIENLLIRDVRAVRDVLLVTNPDIDENRRPSLMNEWTEEVIQQFLTEHKDKKGSKKLIDLANHWGVHYRKTVHNPLIAEHMDPTLITDVQEVVRSFILGTEHATG